jgi:Fe2+ transport system protein B
VDAIYTQISAVLLGLVVGLSLRRIVRSVFTLIAISVILVFVMMATGHGGMVEVNHALVPQAVSFGTQMVEALKHLLMATPGAMAGLLFGVAVREIMVAARS